MLSFEAVGKKARVVLGDETGTVKGFLFNGSGVLKEGVTIVLFKGEARVVKEHIEIQLMERGKIDIANREIKEVDKSIDISAKEWVEQA